MTPRPAAGGRAPRVGNGGGDGFDLLVSAIAAADPGWRDVLAHGPEELLAEVTPGIRYGPRVFGRVVLVGSALVEPILVSVDQPNPTVIIRPLLGVDGMADAARAAARPGQRGG